MIIVLFRHVPQIFVTRAIDFGACATDFEARATKICGTCLKSFCGTCHRFILGHVPQISRHVPQILWHVPKISGHVPQISGHVPQILWHVDHYCCCLHMQFGIFCSAGLATLMQIGSFCLILLIFFSTKI